MRTLLLILALVFFCGDAYGQTTNKYAVYGTVIDAQTMAAPRSFTIVRQNPAYYGVYGLTTLWICLTDADNSVTDLTMTCTGSPNDGTTDYTLQDCSTLVAGVCTSVNASWSKNPSAISSPKCWPWRVDTEGVAELECTFTPTGGAAADLLSVYATFAVKG